MRQASKKDYIIYLTALSLLLSVVENALPRPVPFFRLGFANLPLLWALSSLNFKEYLLLAFGKWLCGSFVSGTLLSPFALMGAGNTFSSALLMYLIHKLSRGKISRYLISQLGAMISAIVQLYIAAIILTDSVLRLLPIMLVLNEISGLVIAYISYRFEPLEEVEFETEPNKEKKNSLPIMILYLVAIISTFLLDDPALLLLAFALSLVLCVIAKRKIMWMIYIVTILAVTLFGLLVPEGRVLFLFVTEGALRESLIRALKLVTLTAISQSFSNLALISDGFIGKVLFLSSGMISTFYESEGGIIKRIEKTLSTELRGKEVKKRAYSQTWLSAVLIVLALLSVLSEVLL
ncbi:MAG: Gx transporter family protein [Sphaerochaetaceae bacterium]|nr:Gx transporter family protein [Sphaerochaetaceae bacterium]